MRRNTFKDRVVEWIIFAVILLVIIHFGIGFDDMSTFGWALVGIIFVLWVALETVFDVGFDWIFVKLGLQSGKGPLDVSATPLAEDLQLTLTNNGKGSMKVVAIEGRDSTGKRLFTAQAAEGRAIRIGGQKRVIVRSFAKTRIRAGQSVTAVLDLGELSSAGCQSLYLLDSNAEAWPVQYGIAQTA